MPMKRIERWLVAAACLAVGCFYLWTVRSSGDPWKFGKEQRDYYNLLIDGYLSGQLNMKVEVPEALLKLEDPYDPGARPAGLGLHDASFYKGKYYVYFGAAPMVVLMLPFRLLTGMDLPQQVAVLVFTYAGFLASVAAWLAIRRRYFPETTSITAVAAVLVLGLAGLGPVLLRRPDMWELPIAGGYCFAMLALYSVWQCLHAERSRGKWLAAASLCAGLAIASRPTYLVASPFLVAPLVWWWWRERMLPWRMALRVGVPLAVVGAAMAWHNYARFDDPLQFGQKYQFSLDYESKLPHFRAAYVPFTVNAHFFSAARWSRYYPFVHRADLGEAPEGFTIHRGDVYGLLTNFPIAWLVLLAPLALWRRSTEDRGRLAAWLASVALLFALSAGLLLFFFSTLARYQMDFAPAFMLLASVGLLSLERWLNLVAPVVWRRVVRSIWIPAAVFSMGFGILFSLGFDRLFNEHNPGLETRVARLLNQFPAVVERAAGVRHGPLELTLRLPERPGATRETLATIGEGAVVDRIFVVYSDDGRVRLGVKSHDRPEFLSRPLPLDRNTVHRVAVTVGSLFPPATHPYFAHKSPEAVRRVERLVGIAVNGEPVLLARQNPPVGLERRVRFGSRSLGTPAYPRFSVSVAGTRRLDDASPWPDPAGNFVRLWLSFATSSVGTCEPLLGFQANGPGMLLAATKVASDRMTFSLEPAGGPRMTSDEVRPGPGRSHELVLWSSSGGSAQPARLWVWLDGALVWAPPVAAGIPLPASVAVGRNSVGSAECAAEFRGEIFSVQQDASGRDPMHGTGDTVRMTVTFPSDRVGGSEPLLVTGRSGAGDLLIVDYLDAQTVRFALDHWGSPTRISQPVRIDFARVHDLEITMASLQAADGVEGRTGLLRVKLDGAVVWEERMEFHLAEAGEIVVGRNAIGGTRCETAFGGEIRSAGRVARE